LKERVVICGSYRNIEGMLELAKRLEEAGYDVTVPNNVPFPAAENPIKQACNRMFYFQRIEQAHHIIIYCKDYLGVGTAMELGYSLARNKRLYLSHESNIPELKALYADLADRLLDLSNKSISPRLGVKEAPKEKEVNKTG